MDRAQFQRNRSLLVTKQEDLFQKIERKENTLNDRDQPPSPSARIKIEGEIKVLQMEYKSISQQIEEIESFICEVEDAPSLSIREQELNYLDSLRSGFHPQTTVYTEMEMSIRGRKQQHRVKVKTTAIPFLELHHDIYTKVSHSFEEDDSDLFTVDTFGELLQIINDYKRIALIGEPGCGKTITLQRITHELAAQAIEDSSNPLPIYVRLGNYANQDIGEFFGQFFDNLPLASYLPNRAILLLDGLNEMPLEQVGRIDLWLRNNESVPVVVSCRVLDYFERKLPLRRVDISSLTVKQIYSFIGNFFEDSDRDRLFWALAGQEARAAWDWYKRTAGLRAKFDDFWFGHTDHVHKYEVERFLMKTIQDNLRQKNELPGILGLVTNPFLLFTVIPIYIHNEEPPQNRTELFEQFIDLLMEKRGKISVTPNHPWVDERLQKEVFATLAHRMFEEHRGTGVEESWIYEVLNSSYPELDAHNLVYLAASASILESRRVGKTIIRFSHQLLQEYFAAIKMLENVKAKVSATNYWPNERWWEPTGWEETALLLAGIQHDATEITKWLEPVNPTLAYRCATQSGVPCDPEALHLLYEPPPGARVSPVARAEWGRILARKGDQRPGVGLRIDGLPDIVWCKVPPGSFVMCGDKELESLGLSWGTQEINLEYSFWISKYPITYQQFEAFLHDGYENSEYWTASGWRWKGHQKDPRLWNNPVFNIPNHPVVGVTWYEAYAFSQWLNAKLHAFGYTCPDSAITAWEVGLPLEAEWEKAARYPDGRRYPWGNEYIPGYANIDETYQDAECGPHSLRRTTAVGIYEAGISYLEIYDMCGNVWEWCLSKWDVQYTYPEEVNPEGTEHRGVRGGSWYNSVLFAPSAAHDCQDADLGVNDVGFRIVLRPLGVITD